MLENVVEMKNILKVYHSVNITAVDHVDFTLQKGTVHSLLGENGAGKSTLMKILYGMNYPYEGDIYIKGKKINMINPRVAIDSGISMVHQHFMLVNVMNVYENIVLGNEPKNGMFFDNKKAFEIVQKIIDEYGFKISADSKIEDLSVGEQQRVEILKALYSGADVLILDEPTAVLTPKEVNDLFKIIEKLKNEGKTIVIITHKLKETLSIADSVSILRDGKLVGSNLDITDMNEEKLAKLMVGRNVNLGINKPAENVQEKCYEIKNLCLKNQDRTILNNINLTLKKGEVLGIAGIEGNGQSELLEIVTGIRKPTSGTLVKDGVELDLTAKKAIDKKIGHIPEDRSTQGLVNEMNIKDNIILGYHHKPMFLKKGIFKKQDIENFTRKNVADYKIKVSSVNDKCSQLSGGNQQKIVIARIFSQDPDVIIVAQPTRGVDVGAMEYIHNKLLELRDEGKAVLLISADLDEVRCLSDKIAVIYEGEIVKECGRDELNEFELGILMTGGSIVEEDCV